MHVTTGPGRLDGATQEFDDVDACIALSGSFLISVLAKTLRIHDVIHHLGEAISHATLLLEAEGRYANMFC